VRRYDRTSTLLTSNRPVDDWGKLLGDTAAITALLESAAASRARAEVWSTQLADKGPGRFAPRRALEVKIARESIWTRRDQK
jgi:hypothetical protein